MNQQSHAINLSWVLHEPSSSDPVRHASRARARRVRQIRRAESRLAALSDGSLRDRTVTAPALQSTLDAIGLPAVVYTTRTGLWRLIPRLLEMCRNDESATSRVSTLDGPLDAGEGVERELFRGQATLVTPADDARDSDLVAFIAAVARPGDRSVLLTGQVIERVAGTGGDDAHPPSAILRLAEEHLIAFFDQWDPPRTLWRVPAEDGLPEFATFHALPGG